MCGRFSLAHVETKWIKQRFHADMDFEWQPRYNLAPKQPALTIISSEGRHLVKPMIWGFVPHWAKQGFAGVINARAETAGEKPMFRASYKTRRCLVLADGFYEWNKKEPYRIILKGGPVFCFAGLYDVCSDQYTFAILTTEANSLLAPLHDRMPVILDEKGEREWLEGKGEVFHPYPGEKMELFRVPDKVNSWRNDTPDCFERWKGL